MEKNKERKATKEEILDMFERYDVDYIDILDMLSDGKDLSEVFADEIVKRGWTYEEVGSACGGDDFFREDCEREMYEELCKYNLIDKDDKSYDPFLINSDIDSNQLAYIYSELYDDLCEENYGDCIDLILESYDENDNHSKKQVKDALHNIYNDLFTD